METLQQANEKQPARPMVVASEILSSLNEYKVNSRKTWQTINELTSRKSGKESITSLKVNGVLITNPTMLSNEFNNHFATIGSKLASNISTSDIDNHQTIKKNHQTIISYQT